eukprot:scaffold408_cov177-Chaetoceros_neogracile.AAC.3
MDSQKDDSFQNQDYRSMYKRRNSYDTRSRCTTVPLGRQLLVTGVPSSLRKEEIRQIRDMCSRIK